MTDEQDAEGMALIERCDSYARLAFARRYTCPIDAVWAALSEPAGLEAWMGAAAVEPQVDGHYRLFTDRADPMLGRVRRWEPPTLLEVDWNKSDAPGSVIRYALASDAAGTRLSFVHDRMPASSVGLMAPGWHLYLERLGGYLSLGRVLEPISAERWRDLQRLYADVVRPAAK